MEARAATTKAGPLFRNSWHLVLRCRVAAIQGPLSASKQPKSEPDDQFCSLPLQAIYTTDAVQVSFGIQLLPYVNT